MDCDMIPVTAIEVGRDLRLGFDRSRGPPAESVVAELMAEGGRLTRLKELSRLIEEPASINPHVVG